MGQLPCFTDSTSKRVVEKLCKENDIDIALLTGLCEIVQEYSGAGRRDGVVEQINLVIDRFLTRTDAQG